MNEHSFIKSVHRSLPASVYSWKIHDTYTGGVPDSFYAGPTGILFVEYKYLPKLPKRDTTELKTTLSALQKQWLNRMCDFNHNAAVVLGCEDTAIILQNKLWMQPLCKQKYMQMAVPRKQIAHWIEEVCCG